MSSHNSNGTDAYWITCRDEQHAASEAARVVLDAFVRSAERDFSLGLSGGRIAPVLFAELVRQARFRQSPLGSSDFFWADERCVKPEDEASNYRIARSYLLEPLSVAPARIHRLSGELPPDRGAERANNEWAEWLDHRGESAPHRLSCVLLGVGEDGHVASLFPQNLPRDLTIGTPFHAVVGPKPPPQRLTMGYPLLWDAEFLVVVATGAGKAAVVKMSLNGSMDTPLARVLRGRSGRETVVISHAEPGAAS